MTDKSHPQNPNLVMFQSQICWLKAVNREVPDSVCIREIDTLIRIEKAVFWTEFEFEVEGTGHVGGRWLYSGITTQCYLTEAL